MGLNLVFEIFNLIMKNSLYYLNIELIEKFNLDKEEMKVQMMFDLID